MANKNQRVSIIVQVKDKFSRGFKKVRGGLKGTERDAKKAAKGVQGMGQALKGALLAAGAFIALRIGQKLFQWGTEAQETAAKFQQVFGQSTEEVDAFAASWGRMAGVTRTASRDLLATTASIGQGMGMAQAQSAEFSKTIFRLSADLGSFSNTAATDVMEALQGAAVGERERLKRMGIVVTQLNVDRRALIETGKASVDMLTAEEKAWATLAIAQEQITAMGALGDLERTSTSVANTWRRVHGFILDTAQTAAIRALPIFNEMLLVVQEWEPAIEATGKGVGYLLDGFRDLVIFLQLAGWGFANFFLTLPAKFKLAWGELMRFLANAIHTLPAGVRKFFGLDGVAASLREGAQAVIDEAKAQIQLLNDATAEGQGEVLDRRLAYERQTRELEELKNIADRDVAGAGGAAGGTATTAGKVFGVGRATQGGRGFLEAGAITGESFGLGAEATAATTPTGDSLVPSAEAMERWREFQRSQDSIGSWFKEAVSDSRTLNQMIGDTLVATFEAFGNAVADAFQVMFEGSKSVAQAFKSAMLGAIGAVAKGLGKLLLGKAAAAFPNFALMAQYTAAAVAMFALAGAMSAAAGSGSGGGGGGFSGSSVSAVQQDVGGNGRGDATVIIEGGFLDLTDPRQEDQFRRALEELSGRRVVIQGGGV